MKAIIEPILSGPACGKQRMRIESNHGKLLGWIQPTNFDCAPTLGTSTVFLSQQCFGNYRTGVSNTLAGAFKHLGISLKELDNSELPRGCYDEFQRSSYRR